MLRLLPEMLIVSLREKGVDLNKKGRIYCNENHCVSLREKGVDLNFSASEGVATEA